MAIIYFTHKRPTSPLLVSTLTQPALTVAICHNAPAFQRPETSDLCVKQIIAPRLDAAPISC